MHQRKVIGLKVRSLLIAAGTDAGQRVYFGRSLPLRKHELPAILVYTLSDTVDPTSALTAPRLLTRDLDLQIDGLVWAETEAEDRLHALAAQIETVLDADPFLGGEAMYFIPVGTEFDPIEQVGDRQVGRIAMTYSARYETEAPIAPTDTDDLETVYTTTNLGGELADEDAAVDDVTVQEAP